MKDKQAVEKDLRKLCEDARYPGSSSLCDFKLEISDDQKDGFDAYRIRITEMYERPLPTVFNGNTLQFFNAVQRAAGTNMLDLVGDVSESGCETCDHGSEYGWDLIAWDDPEIKV